MKPPPELSIIIVSFNTCELLRDCLTALKQQSQDLRAEIFCVDNVSHDRSPEMVEEDFPEVKLIRSHVNLGFAAANNLAFEQARGRYIVLLNSDAFLHDGALQRAIKHMDENPEVGIGGGRLVGQDGSWQPSARMFPSLLNELLTISGLAARFPKSRFFGRFDRTWASNDEEADVDWVPGAFSIIRRTMLTEVGFFDERFFLYYEEVDLCRRFKRAGYRVHYWPDVVVTHLGGGSSRKLTTLALSSSGTQLTLWRMRSAFLYYRKHHGNIAWAGKELERCWHWLRQRVNWIRQGRSQQVEDAQAQQMLLKRAWIDTYGGRLSPSRPWGA
jgi:GT2 family glycosyltransferase